MIKEIKKNLKPILCLTLILSFPLLVLILFGFFLIIEVNLYFREIGAVFLLTAIFIGVILLFNCYKLKKILMLFFQFLLAFIVAFKLFFYFTFNAKPSASAIFIILETNANEASEFFSSYFNFSIALIIFFSFSVFILQLFKLKTLHFLHFNKLTLFFKTSLVLLIIGCFCILKRSFNDQSLLFTISYSLKEYRFAKSYNKENLAQPDNKAIKIISNNKKPQIGVIIIGESTTSWHMQLYNYNRKTNPILSKMKEELYVFNNVISPDIMTIKSLEKVLTLSDYFNPKIQDNFSIVQLANAAGYKTYWISNQQPVGFTESTPTIISTAANHRRFLATDSYFYTIYDEALIPEIKKALVDEGKPKLIFVHLIGTHRVYNKRYPNKFNYFKGINSSALFNTEYSIEKINEYDNAVRYNDFVVGKIISLIKKTQTNSFVVYFSDHGDDVFDTQDFVGHHGSKSSKPMFDIPFLSWFSKEYRLNNPRIDTLKNYKNRKYNAEDFIFSFSDLINVNFEGFDASRSIFNSQFKERKRLIIKNIDYDTWK